MKIFFSFFLFFYFPSLSLFFCFDKRSETLFCQVFHCCLLSYSPTFIFIFFFTGKFLQFFFLPTRLRSNTSWYGESWKKLNFVFISFSVDFVFSFLFSVCFSYRDNMKNKTTTIVIELINVLSNKRWEIIETKSYKKWAGRGDEGKKYEGNDLHPFNIVALLSENVHRIIKKQ